MHPYLSLGSILTGRYPSAIPLCSLPTPETDPESLWCTRIPDAVPTLPEVLGIYGYDTALVAAPPTSREKGLLASEFGDAPGVNGGLSEAVDTALSWWKAHAGALRFLVLTEEILPLVAPRVGPPGSAAPEVLAEQAHTAYGNVVAEAGVQVGRLVAETGPGTWVFVTSGHGANLGETTGTASLPVYAVHRDVLLERTLIVPLHVYGPSAPAALPAVTPLVDLAPTIAHLAGVLPPAGLAGNDLFADPPADPACYAEFGDMLALRTERHLLVARLWMHGGTALDPQLTEKLRMRPDPGSSFTLHDVLADPLQVHDIVQSDTTVAGSTWRRMLEIRTGPGAPPNGGLSPDQVAALRKAGSIGYW